MRRSPMACRWGLAAGMAWCFAGALWADDDEVAPVQNQVPVDEIGARFILMGRLGKPLGTMMTVTGKWGYPDKAVKDYSLRFTVSQVNAKRLDKPVVFNVAQIKAVSQDGKDAIPKYDAHKSLDGVSWTLRAYETGRFQGIPNEYWIERGSGRPASPYWFRTFTSELVGIVQRQ
jgi:hypothetical protein